MPAPARICPRRAGGRPCRKNVREMDSRAVLDLAGLSGKILLQSGAEIYRVQETMLRIMRACGVEDGNVYVVANGIFATVHEGREDEGCLVRHVPLGSVHLGYIHEVNQISRAIEAGTMTPEEALRRVESLDIPAERTLLQVCACAIGSGAFAFLFGGSWQDALAAIPIGVALQYFLLFVGPHLRRGLSGMGGGLLITVCADLLAWFLPVLGRDYIVIGCLMPLVQGVSFTNAIREFFNGDYLAGVTHMLDALMGGVCIACGVAAGLMLTDWVRGCFL